MMEEVKDVATQWKVAFRMADGDRIVHWFDSEREALAKVLQASKSQFVDSSTIEYEEPLEERIGRKGK